MGITLLLVVGLRNTTVQGHDAKRQEKRKEEITSRIESHTMLPAKLGQPSRLDTSEASKRPSRKWIWSNWNAQTAETRSHVKV